jgi:phosphosulfolactate synthase (CoM biosynthesis protein A)
MITFKEHIDEMSVRKVHNDAGDLEELKFGKDHLVITATEKGISINVTNNVLALNQKELKELIDTLSLFKR